MNSQDENTAARIIDIVLDERSIGRTTPEVEHEREIAVFDLLESNVFALENGAPGPYRLRLGIGHPGHRDQVVDYVLRKPSREDRVLIEDAVSDALDVIPEIVDGQFARAMNLLHARKRG